MDKSREVVEVDLSEVSTTAELHAGLSSALGFPSFYGQNWDAFWDSITGLVEMPQQLRFYGWQGFVERFPNEAQKLQKCLEDVDREYPEWALEVEYI
jgi:RNAse (barnase) inhibitor barstar